MPSKPRNSAAFTPGFTLVELMISIAIVLILMLGINFVFSTSAKTISVGLATSAVGRDIRGARATLSTDFSNSAPASDMPAIIIQNEEVYAFRDKQDRLTDGDGNAWTYDADGITAGEPNNGDEVVMQSGTTQFYPGTYNFRRHRIDRLSFFLENNSSNYTRQTGDATTYVGPETSSEAWVNYGPLRLAANDNLNYFKPGFGQDTDSSNTLTYNPNNLYASQWMICRRLTLLLSSLQNNGQVVQSGINYGAASQSVSNITPTPPTMAAWNREVQSPYTTATPWQTQESRIDQVNASIKTLRAGVAALNVALNNTWWTDADANAPVVNYTSPAPAAPPPLLNYMFWAKPFVDKSLFASPTPATAMQMQAREAALTTPIFLRGCMQFIVEFAGDFYDQGAIGGGPEPAGTIDYDVVSGTPPNPLVTQIRWYGIPRDIDGGGINTAPGSVDVNPISIAPGPGAGGICTPRWGAGAYPNEHLPPPPTVTTPNPPTIWAWGPTDSANAANPNNFRPKLIRITLELIDANGRLQDGQRIEFVYKLN